MRITVVTVGTEMVGAGGGAAFAIVATSATKPVSSHLRGVRNILCPLMFVTKVSWIPTRLTLEFSRERSESAATTR